MFNNPPREKEWVSWSYVVLCALIIFLTVPIARQIQEYIQTLWGRGAFTVITLIAIILGCVRAITYLFHQRIKTTASYVWLLLTTAVFIGYTFYLSGAPEEALHFVEYGILGLLIFRALSHKIRDYSIYFTAIILGAIIGTLDETLQWLIPNRFWDYRDIWINLLALSLVQVAIAKGLKPSVINRPPPASSLRLLNWLSITLLLLITASVINTPPRVAWYAEQFELLGFLKTNPSTMSEYGFLYRDSEVGKFRSRLSPEELQQLDTEQGKASAVVLDQYRDQRSYRQFLERYTPYTNSFLHEARVHLFRRDRYLRNAQNNAGEEKLARDYLDVAYRENRIMEKYFTQTLHHSSYNLPVETLALLKRHYQQDLNYDSPVSGHLITGLSEWQLLFGLLSVIFGLIIADRYLIKN